ncbi:DNA polymerase Y family protein [Paracoccus sp. PARArs4]|uniref:Y-family DNA polymerase n=1 Tax=Paracoccus sp. PARArs4 TaxID=2853442 RepID=UPI0024A6555C|nr:DNA polymerase Y family protein [Paracoccus sp. PARArs4]
MTEAADRRIVSMWFPRLASDRILRAHPVEGPFAVTIKRDNAERIHCLNAAAEAEGLSRGMSFADARAFCPQLVSRPADPEAEARFLSALRRHATGWCPWVGLDGADGLVLDATGSLHLWEGAEGLLTRMRDWAQGAGICLQMGIAHSRGAAWGLARFGRPGDGLADLPIEALRLDHSDVVALQRLGLRDVAGLQAMRRGPLARRLGRQVLMRLDQLTGDLPEPVAPQAEPPHFGTRLTLPDPIGLRDDLRAAIARLLGPLCAKLKAHEMGARQLSATMRRVDRGSQQIALRLAVPMRDEAAILPLFDLRLDEVDAGFGIDQVRLVASQVEHLPARQIGGLAEGGDKLGVLISRLGTRLSLGSVQHFAQGDSHVPELGFAVMPAGLECDDAGDAPRPARRPRPVRLFDPEPVEADGCVPPRGFLWRGARVVAGQAEGPERLTHEWWRADALGRAGLRDYWRVETADGRRLWLFHAPQRMEWFVQGEFA